MIFYNYSLRFRNLHVLCNVKIAMTLTDSTSKVNTSLELLMYTDNIKEFYKIKAREKSISLKQHKTVMSKVLGQTETFINTQILIIS